MTDDGGGDGGGASRNELQRIAGSERELVTTVVPAVVERLLGADEVAAALGLCRATVYAMCEDGTLEHHRVRNRIRVPASALQRYLDATSSTIAKVPVAKKGRRTS